MLRVEDVTTRILQGISFRVPEGSCVAIAGPSGSGKTTMLNAIAGAIPYQGTIYLAGQRLDDLPPWQRPCRYLNQRLYLFPYLTVRGNLALAQYAAGLPRLKKEQTDLLEEMGIAHLAERYPRQISGGEQQRAALSRALISRPRLLLLDEPFSSLDRGTRVRLWEVVRSLRRHAVTVVLVTHEPEEAAALADRQLTLLNGRLVSEGGE
ncbi:molybdate transport system ATP-binding protein [Raoultella sp. BIGb0149]|uniref:ABC transporter ATP-binding protein n=1 Tax=Raoultella TaxID=160674 RepID=UPI00106154CC|nr:MULTISPECIES: ATP-binding cassette domain-containing protein [Raoultella]MCI1034148.1 ATP-binding cassette domain-containing protein [Raoultella terrigena]TDQ20676.1 molybdate transport system ATP-binding protein [Raoultella sp. BIGb0149]